MITPETDFFSFIDARIPCLAFTKKRVKGNVPLLEKVELRDAKSETNHRKPDSVRLSEESRTIIYLDGSLRARSPPKRNATSTRDHSLAEAAEPDRLSVFPVLSCTTRGLSCHCGHPKCGELLPRHFTLTRSSRYEPRRAAPSHFEEGLLFVARRAKNGRYIFCDTIRHPAITTRRPGFHRACCRVVSGLSSETRRPQRSSPVCFVRNINGIHFRAREDCLLKFFHSPSNSAPLFHAIVIPTTKKASTESSNKISQSLPGFSAGSIVR